MTRKEYEDECIKHPRLGSKRDYECLLSASTEYISSLEHRIRELELINEHQSYMFSFSMSAQ